MAVKFFQFIIPLVVCHCVTAQIVPTPTVATLTPTPSPSPIFRHPLDCPLADTSRCDPACPYINTECQALGLLTVTSEITFEQRDICTRLGNQTLLSTCSFVGGPRVAFLCPNVRAIFGVQTAIFCFPPNLPFNDVSYCFCSNPEYPRFRVSEVPDVRFVGSAQTVTEAEGTMTVCVISGQLAEEIIPVNATISTQDGSAKGGTDFVSFSQRVSFSASNEMHCVNVSVLEDGVDETNEFFLLTIDLDYAFSIQVDSYNITIVDSDTIGIGFEQDVIIIDETAGAVSLCVATNVTLNGTRTASAVVQTVDVTAQADVDYLAVEVPLLFQINGLNRSCVDITILQDRVTQNEYYEVFLVQLRNPSVSVFAGQVVVVILDQEQLYTFGRGVGDGFLRLGVVASPDTFAQLTLEPSFRFFARDEDNLYVNLNAALSFNQRFADTSPRPFPISGHTLISPYWENFENVRFGNVSYRNTNDPTLLRRAQFFLRDVFPSARDFSPSYLVIATWNNVPMTGSSLVNTLQVVLTTDGERSFTFFIYSDIQWGDGVIGFNAGDGVRSYTLPGSGSPAARNIEDDSNVGVKGVYAYRVDLPEIVGPGGESNAEGCCIDIHTTEPLELCNGGEDSSSNTHDVDSQAWLIATAMNDYQELLSSYVAQNNELQLRGPNVSIRGSSSVELQQPSDSRLYTDCRGQDGVIRLYNGSSVSDGEVEYCLGSTWTPVCGDDWDESEAAVACRQLGFAREGATVALQELGSETPLSTVFNCTGKENNLLECAQNSSVAGSGATPTPAQGGPLQPMDGCFYLARVNCTAVQIGFQQNSYTVSERNESVRVCVEMTTGDLTVPVTLAVLYTGSAQNGTDYIIGINESTTEFLFEGAPQQECIQINILDDETVEQNESFLVIINTTLTSRTVSLNPQYAFVNITDDDAPPSPVDATNAVITGAIAGGIIGGVLIILCVGGMLTGWLYDRRKKHVAELQRQDILSRLASLELVETNAYSLQRQRQGTMVVSDSHAKHMPRDRIIPSSQLRLLNSVGQGEFGIVYKAHLIQSMQAMHTVVAVKTLKGFFDLERISEMMRESIRMMDLDHPHVLNIIGVCLDAGPAPYIVVPFMANGNLLSYIKGEKDSLVFPDLSLTDSEPVQMARKRLADMCLQIAKGMEYLASKNIVHRDLAARNCMIDTNCIIKVADFGLSESTYTKSYFRQKKSKAVKLPVKWLSPEALTEGVFSEKSDVWAYGVTCWELFTGGRIPYPGVDPVSLPNLLENGLKLDKPRNAACNEELYFFMFRCWYTDPQERQTFSELVTVMSQTLLDMADYMDVCTFGELEEAAAGAQDETEDNHDGDDIIIVNDLREEGKDEQNGNDQSEKDKQDGKDERNGIDDSYTKMIEEAKL